MRLRYLGGDRTGALRQYEACAAALQEELGVKPSASTLRLHAQILADQLHRAAPSRHAGEPEPAADQPSLLAVLDHPERGVPVVLVGGTNGKGSASAMLEALLRAHGVRCGLYTSPHLVRPNVHDALRHAADPNPRPQHFDMLCPH